MPELDDLQKQLAALVTQRERIPKSRRLDRRVWQESINAVLKRMTAIVNRPIQEQQIRRNYNNVVAALNARVFQIAHWQPQEVVQKRLAMGRY